MIQPLYPSEAGLLVVGHGTRDLLGQSSLLALTSQISKRLSGVSVEPGFLELAEPTIGQGVQRLAEKGVRRVLVMPLMLFAAGHVRRDIPAAVDCAARRYGMSVAYAPHLGCCESLLRLSALRYREALADCPEMPVEQTLLVMVGRGSRDRRASREMFDFVDERAQMTPTGHIETCFYAMAAPRLKDTLPRIASLPFARVVVQPHLLFAGTLADAIAAVVEECRRQWPTRDWVAVDPLGPHPLVTEAILQRVVLAGLPVGQTAGFTPA